MREASLIVFALAAITEVAKCLPTIDPGVFVLQGVPTCRGGKGYCLLGSNCTVDKDFVHDDEGGNCKELTISFTSMLSFVCCKYVNDTSDIAEEYVTTISSYTIEDHRFQEIDPNPIHSETDFDVSDVKEEDLENLVEIVEVVTDYTGIVDLITRPYRPSTTASTSQSTAVTPALDESPENTSTVTTTTALSVEPTGNPSVPTRNELELSTELQEEESTIPSISSSSPTSPASSTTVTIDITDQEDSKSSNDDASSIPEAKDESEPAITSPIPPELREEQTTSSIIPESTEMKEAQTSSTVIAATSTVVNGLDQEGESVNENNLEVLSLPDEIRHYLATQKPGSGGEAKENSSELSYSNIEGLPSKLPGMSDQLMTTDADTTETENKKTTLLPTVSQNVSKTESTKKGGLLVPLREKNVSSSTDVSLDFGSETKQEEIDKIPETSEPSLQTSLLQKFPGTNDINEEHSEIEPPLETILPYPVNLNLCGVRRTNVMISDQSGPASTYDWCWSAALMKKENGGIDKFECSGTLVELDLVVTTAACLKRLQHEDLSDYRVVLGDSNLRDEMPYGVQYHDIQATFTHPDYLTAKGANANDIGVIRLREVATLGHNVCLACVSQPNAYIPRNKCVVSGYTQGYIPKDMRRDVQGFTPLEGILRESRVHLQDSAECRSTVESLAPDPLLVTRPYSFLCDDKSKSGRTCVNTLDGGSPLVCEVGGRWFLTGISSWSRDCSSDPNIYTKVSSFSDWFLNTRLRTYGFVTHTL